MNSLAEELQAEAQQRPKDAARVESKTCSTAVPPKPQTLNLKTLSP